MQNNAIYKQQPPQTNVTYPSVDCTYSTASIPKPWDYIPKYNVQRDRHQQQQVPFNRENYQHRHSITVPPNMLHGDKTSNEFYSTYQSTSRFPPSPCNKNTELTPNFNTYVTQPHTNKTPGACHQIYEVQTKTSIVTSSHAVAKPY